MQNTANKHTAVMGIRLPPAVSNMEGPLEWRFARLLRGITGPADNTLTNPGDRAGKRIEVVDGTRRRHDDGYGPVTGRVDGHKYP